MTRNVSNLLASQQPAAAAPFTMAIQPAVRAEGTADAQRIRLRRILAHWFGRPPGEKGAKP